MNKMLIKEVKIFNILGVKESALSFDGGASVFVVQSPSNCAIRSIFAIALELVFSAKYYNVESLVGLKDLHRGYVRITFLIPRQNFIVLNDILKQRDAAQCAEACTSQQASYWLDQMQESTEKLYHKIIACRDFRRNITEIEYSINNGPSTLCLLPAFHGMFRTSSEYKLPCADMIYKTHCANLLHWVIKSMGSKGNLMQLNLLTETNHRENAENDLLTKFSKFLINVHCAKSVLQNLYVTKLCRYIRTIFEFINCEEYTVWFFILYQGNYIDMNEIVSEELDFNNIETFIQLKNEEIPRLIRWLDADEGIRDLLLISLDLSLAFIYKQNIVCIRNMEKIKEYQVMKLTTEAYLQKQNNNFCTISSLSQNYVQRIIDTCQQLRITAVIEYFGGLHLAPINARIVKCFTDEENTCKMIVLNISNNSLSELIENVESILV